MTHFSIDADYNITAHAEKPAATETETLLTKQMLRELPTDKLAQIWDALAGLPKFADLKPFGAMKKVNDRGVLVRKLWDAIQRLGKDVEAKPEPDPIVETVKKAAAIRKALTKAKKVAKASRKVAAPAKVGKAKKPAVIVASGSSKKDAVINLMRRKEGVSAAEIMKLTDWQAHTVRGFMAGTLKKAGIKVESFQNDQKERCYRVA